jgi:sugar lactone lactonase YvrE
MRATRRCGKLAGVVLVLLAATWSSGSSVRATAALQGAQVMTLAGSGEVGFSDGTGGSARFAYPAGIAVDAAGVAYVVDGNRIRRVSATGDVRTLAGTEEAGFADGPAAAARFDSPQGIAVDATGTLYIADRSNHRIRTLSPRGVVATLAGSGTPGLADGPGDTAQFNEPYDVAVDTAGVVYVADALNHRIRRINPQGVVTTLAGGADAGEDAGGYADGPATVARFSYPTGLAVDATGIVYVADTYNARIRAVSPQGVVRTVAGPGEDGGVDGPAALASFSDPAAIAVAGSGNLYVLDKSNRVRLISTRGEVTSLAGSGEQGFADGFAETAQFDQASGIAVSAAGTVYVADTGNLRIRIVLPPA